MWSKTLVAKLFCLFLNEGLKSTLLQKYNSLKQYLFNEDEFEEINNDYKEIHVII